MNVPKNILFLVVSILLTSSFILAPLGNIVSAIGVSEWGLPGLDGKFSQAQQAVNVAQGATVVTSVPTQDPVSLPKSILKGISVAIARKLVQRVVNSTLTWINSGFEGKPIYVTDSKAYFSKLANGIVGDFIATSSLGFLCSPFQVQVQASLKKFYTQDYVPQCTFTGIVGNLENFYNDFSSDGWNGWFSMTQNDANNPYGTYFSAKVELDTRLANALGIAKDDLQINDGFLSTKDCITKNPMPFQPGYNPNHDPGDCLEYGPVKTPGKVIADQTNHLLHAGVDQILTANDVDALASALLGQLLQKTVFSVEGLFQTHPYQDNSDPTTGDVGATSFGCSANVESAVLGTPVVWTIHTDLTGVVTARNWTGDEIPADSTQIDDKSISVTYNNTGNKAASVDIYKDGNQIINVTCPSIIVSNSSCSANLTNVKVNTPVLWTANPGSYPTQQYQWEGDNLPSVATTRSATNSHFVVSYTSPGTKHAAVHLFSAGATTTSANIICTNPITVSNYDPLTVSCSPSVSTAKVGDDVTWTAIIEGGSGKFQNIQFAGGEEKAPLPPGISGSSVNINIWPTPNANTVIPQLNTNATNLRDPLQANGTQWIFGPLLWPYTNPSDNTQHSSSQKYTGTLTSTTVDIVRTYFTATSTPNGATITVVDASPSVQPITAQACTGGVTITP